MLVSIKVANRWENSAVEVDNALSKEGLFDGFIGKSLFALALERVSKGLAYQVTFEINTPDQPGSFQVDLLKGDVISIRG